MSRPGTGNASAEDRRAKHGSFEARLSVDVAAGHAGYFSGSIQSRDRLEVFVLHAAMKVRFDAAKILAREREELDRIERRRVEFLRELQ